MPAAFDAAEAFLRHAIGRIEFQRVFEGALGAIGIALRKAFIAAHDELVRALAGADDVDVEIAGRLA